MNHLADYRVEPRPETSWAGWATAFGSLIGALLVWADAPDVAVVAGTAFGAASARVLAVIAQRALAKVGLG